MPARRKSSLITGYYKSYSGWDDATNVTRFSCVFYIDVTLKDGKSVIKTYFPREEKEYLIEGTLEPVNNTIEIKLNEEHSGCWNVQHFANEHAKFELVTTKKWLQIRFVKATKTYFYKTNDTNKKAKQYLIN